MGKRTLSRLGWAACGLGVVSLALMAVSVWGFRGAGWPWPQALRVATWAVAVAFVGGLLALGGLSAWLSRRSGGGVLLLGMLLCMPVAGLGISFQLAAWTTPAINDISTDTADPPVFWNTKTPTDYPPANADPQHWAYPSVHPVDLKLAPDAAFKLARDLVEARGWKILSADPADGQIEAIATSFLFGFQDEVAIRLTPIDGGTRVDMRSRSRIGLVDRGANARRIEAFLTELSEGIAI